MKLMGHRGAAGEVDENTLPSFELAIKLGLPVIEFDIHKSSDGELVVIHDSTLDRTTNMKGSVVDFTYQEIAKAKTKSGYLIPRLTEVLELAKKHSIQMQLEIKAPNLEVDLITLIKKLDLIDLSTVICFDHRALLKVKTIAPEIKTAGLLFGRVVDPIHVVKTAKLDGLSLSIHTVDKEIADLLHENKKTLTIWNANNEKQMAFVKTVGPDLIGTDFPSTVLKHV